VYEHILKIYGENNQILQSIQEFAEFIAALTRYLLKEVKNHDLKAVLSGVIEEGSDSELMLRQMRSLFGDSQFDRTIREKLDRLHERMIETGVISEDDFPRGRSIIRPIDDILVGNWETSSPALQEVQCPIESCESKDFEVSSIERSVLICQCSRCHNLFMVPGLWTFPDGPVKVRRRRVG
jgi:hypothetical protein